MIHNYMLSKLRVGFDFDGVIMYNPARLIRPFMAFLKLKKVVRREQLHFYQPHTPLAKWLWWFAHQSSIIPADGLDHLKQLVQANKIEAFVITGRNTMLKDDLCRKLASIDAHHLFLKCYITQSDEQPHLFKEKMIKNLALRYFVEDNWDIVQYLNEKVGQYCTVIWVYNWLDRDITYHHKVADLAAALKMIEQEANEK